MRRMIQFAAMLSCAVLSRAEQPIGILFDFATRPDSTVVNLMESEIRKILAPAHLQLSFLIIGESSAARPFRKIVVVHFQGSCQSRSERGIYLNNSDLLDYPALGKTDVSGGHILPYVRVYCNEIRAFMPSSSRASRGQLYGRALGRVVVHELYHALLSTRDHSRNGVARFAQSGRDLTRDRLALDSRSLGRLRELYGPKEKE